MAVRCPSAEPAAVGAVVEGVDAVVPGPQLGALLDAIDLDRVNGYQAVCLARAAARQVAHDQARLLAVVATIARCTPGGPDAPPARCAPDLEAAADEIAFGLTLTRTAAGGLLDLAETTVVDHPDLHHALAAGMIDLPKLRVITDAARPLDPATATTVITKILPEAPQLTTGQLRAHLGRLILCTDPHGVTQRREHGQARRRVLHYTDTDHTATLTATGLPLPHAAAAWDRLDTLAHTAQHRGDPRSIDQLRADLFLDLLTGTHPPASTHPASTDPNPTARATPGSTAGPRLGSLHVIAPLRTLQGLSQDPAHLTGWGPIAADVLHQLTATAINEPAGPSNETRIQVNVTDDHNHLIAAIPINRRYPTAAQTRHIRARDHTCRAPGCQTPAHHCDIDHTTAHTNGGPTHTANLGLLCRHHHRIKHQHGYSLTQPTPGQFTWTTPHGHTYHREEQHPP